MKAYADLTRRQRFARDLVSAPFVALGSALALVVGLAAIYGGALLFYDTGAALWSLVKALV